MQKTITINGRQYNLYEDLPVQEEATLRPTYYGKPMKQTAIWLPEEMIEWLKSQPGKTMSEVMRGLIKGAMDTSDIVRQD